MALFGKLGGGGYTVLARWTTDWDCGYETNWWYVIKDTPFDINALKAKRRYEITKGRRNFDVCIINSMAYIDDIIRVTFAAYQAWPEKYRPNVDKESMRKSFTEWIHSSIIFAAFDRSTKRLNGYAVVEDNGYYVNFSILRTEPVSEKMGINAAIVDAILQNYNSRFLNGFYICDGSRSIRHETAFQDYLEKYFGFRKAYCRLNIEYKHCVSLMIKSLYPFRKWLRWIGFCSIGSQMLGLLKMEDVIRCQN